MTDAEANLGSLATIEDFLQEAIELFADTPRPAHFTNYTHCC